MLYYIDYPNKVIYIMSPKCGTQTIANMLNVPIHTQYNIEELNNKEYKKIIIVRKDILSRFMSGFYEDLLNNTCYDNMNITFSEYLSFLYKCSREKISNVNNLNVYLNKNIPVWFGNDSNKYYNITDTNGNFCNHIMSQEYAIGHLINYITCTNVKVIDLSELSSLLPNAKICNVKSKIDTLPNDEKDLSNILLSDIKSKKILVSKKCLNDQHVKMIIDMYKDDLSFIYYLENKYTA